MEGILLVLHLNFPEPEGLDLLLRLIETADVFIENMKPGRIEEMGIGPEILLERNPDLVIARVTEDDLRTHLRGANVSDLAEIRAVVMEGTGTIHVLHGEHAQLDKPRPWILNNVWDYPDH